MHSARVWLLVSPVIAAGVLTAHSLAYRLAGTPPAPFHSYLEHAPQVLLVLAICGVVVGAFGRRLSMPPSWAFPAVALATFLGQEQLERLVHGEWTVSFLAAPVFVIGLALQIPVAVVAWALARWLIAAIASTAQHRPVRASFKVLTPAAPRSAIGSIDARAARGRAPPALAPSS